MGEEGVDLRGHRRRVPRHDPLRAVGPQGPARPEPERARGGRRGGPRPQRQAHRRLEPGRPLPRDAHHRPDGQVRAEGGARGRGPQLLHPRRARTDVDRARGLGQRHHRRGAPGRQHHHPAAGQDPAPHAGKVPDPQAPGGRARGRPGAAVLQGPDPRHVPEPRLLRPRRLRRGRGGQDVFQQRREGPDPGAGRVPRRHDPGARGLRPEAPLRPGAGPRALRPARHGRDRRSEPGRGGQSRAGGREVRAADPGERAAEQGAALRRLRAVPARDDVRLRRRAAGRHRRQDDARPGHPAARGERGGQRRPGPDLPERQQLGAARRQPQDRGHPRLGRLRQLRGRRHRRSVRRRPLQAPARVVVQAVRVRGGAARQEDHVGDHPSRRADQLQRLPACRLRQRRHGRHPRADGAPLLAQHPRGPGRADGGNPERHRPGARDGDQEPAAALPIDGDRSERRDPV